MKLTHFNSKQLDPFQEMFDLDRRMFGLTMFPFTEKNSVPAVDVSEDDTNIFVKADLPGLKKEDIHVTVDKDVLIIKGERKEESERKGKNFHRVERSYGTFERSLSLGIPIDQSKINAEYRNGVLEIVLPKSEQAKPKQIEVKVQ